MKRMKQTKQQNTGKNIGCLPFVLIFIAIIVLVLFTQDGFKKDIDYFMRGESDISRFVSEVQSSYSENMSHPNFIMPLGGFITSPFGERINPVTNMKEEHTGIDIDINAGLDVLASESGTIKKVGTDERFGNYIIIQHNKVFQTCYAHLEESLKKEGDAVTKGDKIGIAGGSGVVTGKHLHFEIRKNDIRVSPSIFIATK